MPDPIESILQDHRNLDKVLVSMLRIIDEIDIHQDGAKPVKEIDLLFSILHYIRVYPDRHHHPKEDLFILAPIRNRAPSKLADVEEIEAQHHGVTKLTDDLAAAVKYFDEHFPSGYEALAERAKTYATFQRNHMRIEETILIPLAKEVLSDEEREAAGRAFKQHGDPLFQENIEAGFQALLDRITR